MNRNFKAINVKNSCLVLMIAMLLGIGFSSNLMAEVHADTAKVSQNSDKKAKKKRVRRAQTMRPKIFKKLDKVRELVDEKKYDEALSSLKSIGKVKRNSYEVAMTWNMHAYHHFNQENYAQAAAAYEKVISTKRVPDSLMQTTLYSLAKLYLVQEKYQVALTKLNNWFELAENPGADALMIRAQAHYQLEQFQQSLTDIKHALSITQEKGKKPKENWLLMARAVYYQNKDYQGMERSLKELIALYPNSTSVSQYWVQLSAVYNELGQPEAELAALETAYDQGLLLKEAQLVSLAQAMLGKEIPYKAAQILLLGMKNNTVDKNAKNLSLLADSLMLAKEYEQAILVMEKAAKLSDSAKDYYKLAQIHTERQDWAHALMNVSKALDKIQLDIKQTEKQQEDQYRDVKRLGSIKENEARILKGLILFNMKDLLLAQAEFEVAAQFPESKKIAHQWLTYIESEAKRIAFIAGTE